MQSVTESSVRQQGGCTKVNGNCYRQGPPSRQQQCSHHLPLLRGTWPPTGLVAAAWCNSRSRNSGGGLAVSTDASSTCPASRPRCPTLRLWRPAAGDR